jgi:hypothetical protein
MVAAAAMARRNGLRLVVVRQELEVAAAVAAVVRHLHHRLQTAAASEVFMVEAAAVAV